MDTEQITIYLCSEQPNGIIVPTSEQSDEHIYYDEENELVTVYLHKEYEEDENDCMVIDEVKKVIVLMKQIDSDLIDCIWKGVNYIGWKRGVQEYENLQSATAKRDNYLTIEWANPEEFCGRCFWEYTAVRPHFPTNVNPSKFMVKTFLTPQRNMIPENASQEDMWVAQEENTLLYIHTESQPNLVPGCKIESYWRMKGVLAEYYAGAVIYFTPMLTGGTVLDILDAGTVDMMYVIEYEGAEYQCKPTDFAEYRVGDFVYLLRQGANEASIVNRSVSFGEESGSKTSGRESIWDVVTEDESSNYILTNMLNRVNVIRQQAGVSLIEVSDDALQSAAYNHAYYNAQNGYFTEPPINGYYGHSEIYGEEGFTGETPEMRVSAAGYTGWESGENVAKGYTSDKAVFEGWVNSPSHYLNMINGNHTEMAYSKVQEPTGNREWMYCMILGGKRASGFVNDDEISDFRLVPFTMGQHLTYSDFETIDFYHKDEFEKVFELAYHEGEIVDKDVDTVSVELTVDTGGDEEVYAQTFSDVAVFYHCPFSAEVKGGIDAFIVGDRVLVLNEKGLNPDSSDLTVIGFVNKIELCEIGAIIVITAPPDESGDTFAFAWDTDFDHIVGEYTYLDEVVDYVNTLKKQEGEVDYTDSSEIIISQTPESSDPWHVGHNLPKLNLDLARTSEMPHGFPDVPDEFIGDYTYGKFASNGVYSSYGIPSDYEGDGFAIRYKLLRQKEDESNYKSSYLVYTGGAGRQDEFDTYHDLGCPTGDNVGTGGSFVEYNYVPYEQVYFHSMFFSEIMTDEEITYENCQENLEYIMDTWPDEEWECIPEGYHYAFQYNDYYPDPTDNETHDPNIVAMQIAGAFPTTYRGPINKLSACWLDSGLVEIDEVSVAYEFLHIAKDVRMDPDTTIINEVLGDYSIRGKVFVKKYTSSNTDIDLITNEFISQAPNSYTFNFLIYSSAQKFSFGWRDMLLENNYTNLWELPEKSFSQYIHEDGYLLHALKSSSPDVIVESDLLENIEDIDAPGGITLQMFRIIADMNLYELEGNRAIYLQDDSVVYIEETKQISIADVVGVFFDNYGSLIEISCDEIGVDQRLGSDNLTYITVFFTRRQYKWEGYYPVKTSGMINAMETNFQNLKNFNIDKNRFMGVIQHY